MRGARERALSRDASRVLAALTLPEMTLKELRAQTDTVLLSFSTGKDSIAAWLALRDTFKVVPVYLYLIPHLEFVERALSYYESFFHTKIMRLPHPSLLRMLRGFVFQPPERIRLIQAMQINAVSFEDIYRAAAQAANLPHQWTAIGVRSADSPARRIAAQRFGMFNETRKVFYPLSEWKRAEVTNAIRDANIKLPADYSLFGRSFDGIDFRFLAPVREHYPNDYARILEWFPLVEMELLRHREPTP